MKNYERAPVTLGRVQRYYALLCEIGLDRVFDAPQRAPVVEGKAMGLGEAARTALDVPRIDLGAILRGIAVEESLLYRFADLVFVLGERDDPSEIPAAEFREALGFFVEASSGLFSLLLGTESVTARAKTNGTTGGLPAEDA